MVQIDTQTQQFMQKWTSQAVSAKTVPAVIGVTGRARAGKDTIASYLVQMHDYTVLHFADPIKDMMECLYPLVNEHQIYVDKETINDTIGLSPRYMMQTLGTEWGRKLIHKDLWLLVLKAKAQSYIAAGIPVVVADVRFDNEAELIKELGGEVWLVQRDTSSYNVNSAHASESGISKHLVDKVLDNTESCDHLYDLIELALNQG